MRFHIPQAYQAHNRLSIAELSAANSANSPDDYWRPAFCVPGAMNIGYPCSNLGIGCSPSRTFRLASYSPERLIATVHQNLDCLESILEWNRVHGIRYFRISSDTVPFASHPVMTVDWRTEFASRFADLGRLVRDHDMRVNCHPGQYILLNSPRPEVVERSVAELDYTAAMFDLMGLDHTHKMQIHTGGVYGDKPAAMDRFVREYETLSPGIRRRLVIENDERQYSLADNLAIHARTGIPVLFDVFHHSIFNNGESVPDAMDLFMPTWRGNGLPAMDYSAQHAEKQSGAHATSVDLAAFNAFLDQIGDRDVDIMLEIKDKETSVLAVLAALADRQIATGRAPMVPSASPEPVATPD